MQIPISYLDKYLYFTKNRHILQMIFLPQLQPHVSYQFKWHYIWYENCFNLLNPHDASKHTFALIKNNLIVYN